MQKKLIRRSVEIPSSDALTDLHPVLQRVYAARGIRAKDELHPGLDALLPFHSLLQIDRAAALLSDALEKQQSIVIVGDFDADGATSTAVAVRALKSFGAKHVDFFVPNRFNLGYGLTPELVALACAQYRPDLIVTVDNGIANHEGVIAAKKAGIRVVITDHHLPGATLPPADAIVNPNQPQDPFPSKCMAGVGVIFYVMLALRRCLIEQGWFERHGLSQPKMSSLLDLVALGTVADVVPLDQNNRIFISQGLRRIRAGQCIPGIIALLEVAGKKNRERLTASDLGFIVAPRLNAAGRLEDMSLGIACLLSDHLAEARTLAARLNRLNEERRQIEQSMQTQALQHYQTIAMNQAALPNGLCLYDEKWHQGVIGILASRLKDRFYRPVIVFANGNTGEIKGSARSIPGIHVRDVLANIATQHPGLILKFGGHAMAAGLTILSSDLENFMHVFDETVTKQLKAGSLEPVIFSDGELQAEEMSLEMAECLRNAGPWGQGFPEPIFDGAFVVVEQRRLMGKHLKLVLKKDQRYLQAIAFNVPHDYPESIHMAYRLDVNEFQGNRNLQLMVEHVFETAESIENVHLSK